MSYYNRNQRVLPQTSTDWLYKSVDKTNSILKLSKPTGSSSGSGLMSLADLKPVGSYNWSTTGQGEQKIPGAAATLKKDLSLSQLLSKKGDMIVDQNRHHQPDYPLEALFRAVQICSPKFDFAAVQFVTDRNNLLKMLDYVEGKSNESFRIDFQRVGNMVLLIRNEEYVIKPCDNYGKDFERIYTESLPDHGSHYRIVSYKFGDFNMLVRFEVDCVINEQNPESLVELTTSTTKEFPKFKWGQMFFSHINTLYIGWHFDGKLLKKTEERKNEFSFRDVTERSYRSTADAEKSLAKLHELLRDLLNEIRKLSQSHVYSIVFDHTESNQEIIIYKCANHKGALPETRRQFILNTQ